MEMLTTEQTLKETYRVRLTSGEDVLNVFLGEMDAYQAAHIGRSSFYKKKNINGKKFSKIHNTYLVVALSGQ
jgi:hypothetical protein